MSYQETYLKNQYDKLAQTKSDALRQTYTQLAQNIKGVGRYNQQNGVTGGAAETTIARLNSNAQNNAQSINTAYNPQLAELSAQLVAYRNAAGGVQTGDASGNAYYTGPLPDTYNLMRSLKSSNNYRQYPNWSQPYGKLKQYNIWRDAAEHPLGYM